jgi:hypothetical protein
MDTTELRGWAESCRRDTNAAGGPTPQARAAKDVLALIAEVERLRDGREWDRAVRDELLASQDHLAKENSALGAEAARLREGMLDATASLAGAASAYRQYASRHRSVGRAQADPFFTTRASDFDRAVARARAVLRPDAPEDENGPAAPAMTP